MELHESNITLFRGQRQVISDITIGFSTGITALLGPNGAGKTTLLEYLAGVGTAKRRRRRFASRVARNLRGIDQREYGFMPQHWGGHPPMTALESVTYAGWLKGLSWATAEMAAQETLAEVALEEAARVPISKLSGGMRQRVGLAEALVHRPDMILLDEPTVGLDPAQRVAFRDILRERGGSSVVALSTHLTEDVDAIADRVVVINEGRVRYTGTLAELRSKAGVDERTSASQTERAYLAILAETGAA